MITSTIAVTPTLISEANGMMTRHAVIVIVVANRKGRLLPNLLLHKSERRPTYGEENKETTGANIQATLANVGEAPSESSSGVKKTY